MLQKGRSNRRVAIRRGSDRRLTVDQQQHPQVFCARRIEEFPVSLIAASTWNHRREAAHHACTFKQGLEGPSALANQVRLTRALDIDLHSHQRLPPNWPLCQSCPRL